MRWLPIVFIALMTALGGCRNRVADRFFFWDSTTAEFDTLTRDLDRAWAMNEPIVTIDSLTAMADSMARCDGTNVSMHARALYYRGRAESLYDWDASIATLDSARTVYRRDSVKYRYALARIGYLMTIAPHNDAATAYMENLRLSEFFRDAGDSVMYAVTLGNLGNEIMSLGDTAASMAYFDRMVPILERMGMEAWRRRFQLSRAQGSRGTDNSLSDSIMRSLLSDTVLMRDRKFYNIVLYNAYKFTGDIGYVHAAYPLIAGDEVFMLIEGLYDSHIARAMLDSGAPAAQVMPVVRRAIAKTAGSRSFSTKVNVADVASDCYALLGRTDSALYWMRQNALYLDSMRNEGMINEICRSENRLRIAERESEMREERLRSTARMWFAIAVVMLVAATVVIAQYRRNKLLEIRKARAELDLTRHKLQLASTAAMLEEKDKVLESVNETVAAMRNDNKISETDARMVSSVLRIHGAVRSETVAFQHIYEKIHPSFRDRLKSDFPELSDSNIRLAAYICIGMSNRQIARVAGIDYKSVITSRHRLRRKMGLTRDDNLRDALGAYADINGAI